MEDLFGFLEGQSRQLQTQLSKLFLGEGEGLGFYIELLTMVQLLFLPLFDPVVDGPDASVFLDDGDTHPVLDGSG